MMNSSLFRWLFGTTDPPYSIFLRISVGLIFSTQRFLKYVDPNLGVNRFTKIGFPYPDFTAHFVVAFEMICGVLVLLGIWTRAAAIPLLIVNLTAIASTKIPELWQRGKASGTWLPISGPTLRCSFRFYTSLQLAADDIAFRQYSEHRETRRRFPVMPVQSKALRKKKTR